MPRSVIELDALALSFTFCFRDRDRKIDQLTAAYADFAAASLAACAMRAF